MAVPFGHTWIHLYLVLFSLSLVVSRLSYHRFVSLLCNFSIKVYELYYKPRMNDATSGPMRRVQKIQIIDKTKWKNVTKTRRRKKTILKRKEKKRMNFEVLICSVSMLFDWWLLFVCDQMSDDFFLPVIANEFKNERNRSEEKKYEIKWKLLFREDIKAHKMQKHQQRWWSAMLYVVLTTYSSM